MNELADLLRELIGEIQDLKSEVLALRGPMGHDLSDVCASLVEIENATAPLPPSSIFGIDDLHTELANIADAISSK